MTPEPLHDPPRLPFRRLLLMPWRWGRWVWCAFVALVPGFYFSTAGFVYYGLLLAEMSFGQYGASIADIYFAPAGYCAGRLPWLEGFYVWQVTIFDALFFWGHRV